MARGHGRELPALWPWCRQRDAHPGGRTWNSWLCGGCKVPGQLSPSPSGALFSCSCVVFGARHCCHSIPVLGSGLGSGSTWNLHFGRLFWPFMALCAKGGLPVLPGVGVSLVVCCGSGQCHVGCSMCSAVLGSSCVPTAQEIWSPASPAAFSTCATGARGMSPDPLAEVLMVSGACSPCSIPVG